MSTLVQRAENARLRKEIAADKLHEEQYKQYLNKNLRVTRKRRATWSDPGAAERDLTTVDRQKVIASTRQKVEENPLVHGLFQTLADNIVGWGWRLSMRTPDTKFNTYAEDWWKDVKDHMDIRGVRPLMSQQRMWEYRKDIDGDVGLVLTGKKEQGAESKIQTIEAERIYRRKYLDDGITVNGDGKPTRYWVGPRPQAALTEPPDPKKVVSYRPADFIHYANFPQERAERLRGVGMLLPCLNQLQDIEQVLEAVVQKIENESVLGLFFGMDPGGNGQIFGDAIQSDQTAEDGTNRAHVKMLPGMNINGAPGEKVEVIESKSPNSEIVPFVKFILRYISVNFGMPLEYFLIDFTESNYSQSRGAMQLAQKRFKVMQAEHSFMMDRIFRWRISRAQKYEGFQVPKALRDTSSWWRHAWGKPGWPYLDPLKEIMAETKALDSKLTSRTQILSDKSDSDIEDVFGQLEHENTLAENFGLVASGNNAQVQATALNGAQVSSLVAILEKVTLGTLTKDSAKATIRAAFPALTDDQVNGMVDPIEVAEPKEVTE